MEHTLHRTDNNLLRVGDNNNLLRVGNDNNSILHNDNNILRNDNNILRGDSNSIGNSILRGDNNSILRGGGDSSILRYYLKYIVLPD